MGLTNELFYVSAAKADVSIDKGREGLIVWNRKGRVLKKKKVPKVSFLLLPNIFPI